MGPFRRNRSGSRRENVVKIILWVGALAAAYQTGASLGHALGVQQGLKKADHEWARMLENDMVGPGSKTRPGVA